MQSKMTPGPWHLSHDLGNALSVAKEIAPNCGRLLLIADVHKGKQNFGGISRNECEANAKAIAALPELVEALQYSSTTLKRKIDYFPSRGLLAHSQVLELDELSVWHDTITEALRKAGIEF